MGYTGHHRSQCCHTKTPSVSPAPQIPHHSPRVHTYYHNAASKPPVVFTLRPIERAHNWKRKWQHGHLNFNMSCPCHMQHMWLHASHTSRIPSRTHRIKPSFPLLHERYISPQCPDCVRNEGECWMHHVRARMPMFACARLCLSCPFRSPCWLSFSSGSAHLAALPHSLDSYISAPYYTFI
jgi:hypothetical protein